MDNVVALIVTYNRIDKLKKTLYHTLLEPFSHVVIVNNASEDGTIDYLNSLISPKITVINNSVNLGGAGGFNIGFEYIANNLNENKWLVCFDDDAYPQKGVVSKFNSYNLSENTAICAAAVYYPSNRICEMNRPSKNPFWSAKELFKTIFKGSKGFHISDKEFIGSTSLCIDASSFVGCFVKIDLLVKKHLGLPRRELFIYADDIIYTLEARKKGFSIQFLPKVKFIHDCETLLSKDKIYSPLWKVYYTYRNGLEMYRVASNKFIFPFVVIIKITYWFYLKKHYKGLERKKYLTLLKLAIKHGLARKFTLSLCELKKIGADPDN